MHERRIIQTSDGSPTLHIPEWKEQYHSLHGAIQEAYHVFINSGLGCFDEGPLRILEMGFGTGLNALITFLEAGKRELEVSYTALEAFPVRPEEWEALDYGAQFEAVEAAPAFRKLHIVDWGEFKPISERFRLRKLQMDFNDFSDSGAYDLIYFDAFGARVQPELWTDVMFQTMYDALLPGGVLVTYSAKGSVRRAMSGAGFRVERLPGPPGKREMLRAFRPIRTA